MARARRFFIIVSILRVALVLGVICTYSKLSSLRSHFTKSFLGSTCSSSRCDTTFRKFSIR